jgi:hypothetical protein
MEKFMILKVSLPVEYRRQMGVIQDKQLSIDLQPGSPNPNLQNQELTRRFLLKIRRKFRRFLLKSGSFLVVFFRGKLEFSLIRMIVILS